MKKIFYTIKTNNLVKQDLKKFSLIRNSLNPIVALPDIHFKRGEMSPTGSVLLSENAIIPCFTHLSVGSGLSAWVIKNLKIEKKKLSQVFKKISDEVPGRSSKRPSYLPGIINDKFIKDSLMEGANILVKKKMLNKHDLQKLENNGNFYKNHNYFSRPEKTLPKELLQSCINEFGCMGTGNTFIELHKIKEVFCKNTLKKWNIDQKDSLLLIHSGSSAAYLNLYFTPRWGVRGKKFIQFEKQKWDYHRNHLKDKESILNKLNYFPGANKYFSIKYPSYDAKLYLSAINSLTNLSMVNRLWLGIYFNQILKNKFKSKITSSLLWDSCHDSIQKINKTNKKNFFCHRHGASIAINKDKLKKNSYFKKTGLPIILPTAMGLESYILKSEKGVEKTFQSTCHGTGRSVDRPEARKKFTNKDTVNYLKKKGCKLFYKKSILSGEHPESFKATNTVLKSGKKHNLFSKVLKTKPLYILKS